MKKKHPYKRRPQNTDFPFFAVLSWGVLVFMVIWSLFHVLKILQPFFAPLICAGLLACVFYPLYQVILKWLNGRENLASILTIIVIVTGVIAPLSFLTGEVIDQGEDIVQKTRQWHQSGQWKDMLTNERLLKFINHPHVDSILDRLQIPPADEPRTPETLMPVIVEVTSKALNQTTGKTIAIAGKIFGNLFVNLVNVLIALFALFHAFRDGPRMLTYGGEMLPLKSTHERAILSQIRNIAQAILVGSFLTAVSQALVAMIALKIVGIPTLFWGLLIALASLIPVVGTALIWVPLVVYLYLKGDVWQATFLFIWCAAAVGTVDNFLRPFFMKGKSGMSTIVLFFALLGGLQVYGAMGLIYGPLIFGICAVLLVIYRMENQEALMALESR
ncbi:MAG: AI-2E family transporter [Lentisphaeria bacterium]|nr:AI-2E family transporter [Lentisphaeria bacterium]